MAYRIVEITNPCEVHVMNHQLLIEQEEEKFSIPLEDIDFMRVENTKKNCIKHQNRIKEFLPKTGCVKMFILTENQFSSCVLSQEVVDFQEYHVGAKDLVTL